MDIETNCGDQQSQLFHVPCPWWGFETQRMVWRSLQSMQPLYPGVQGIILSIATSHQDA